MKIYKHKISGMYLRLIKIRDSNRNTYLEVDKRNNPVVKQRSWSSKPKEQRRIVTGFNNLEEITL